MTINENTRKARVVRWKAKKSVWDLKLADATNETDIAEAKTMIDEAEGFITRLEGKDKPKEKISEMKGPDEISKRKVRKTDMYPHKAKDSADTTDTQGL